MLSKRYESTEVDRRTWLHVPFEMIVLGTVSISLLKSLYVRMLIIIRRIKV